MRINSSGTVTAADIGKQRKLSLLLGLCCLLWGQYGLAANPAQGSKIYSSSCKNCHGANGESQFPGTPDFSRGERLLQSDNALLATIRDGKGMMPAYRGILKDEEILDVIAHLRTFHR